MEMLHAARARKNSSKGNVQNIKMESIIFRTIKCDVKMHQIVMACHHLGHDSTFISETNRTTAGGCKMMGTLEGNKLHGWILILSSLEH